MVAVGDLDKMSAAVEIVVLWIEVLHRICRLDTSVQKVYCWFYHHCPLLCHTSPKYTPHTKVEL